MNSILYIEINIVCIIVLSMVFVQNSKYRFNDAFHVLFSKVLCSNILFFATDIAWGICELSTLPLIKIKWCACILYFIMLGVVSYFWLIFAFESVFSGSSTIKPLKCICLIPVVQLAALSILSIKTHWIFYIDSAGNYYRGNLYFLQFILTCVLPICVALYTIFDLLKHRKYEDRKYFKTIFMLYIPPLIGSMFQYLLLGTPSLNIGIVFSVLWAQFTFQERLIMLDPLTEINNRRMLDMALETMTKNYDKSSGKSIWLAIIDIDHFKKINDNFGHLEGDKIIVIVANILKNACKNCNSTVARIGGDEFIICCETKTECFFNLICETIREDIKEESVHYPFEFNVSIGYAKYTYGMTHKELFDIADKKLYEEKQSKDLTNYFVQTY